MTTQAPSDIDVIKAFVRAGIAQIHVSLPATVIVYDPVTQKATVQPAIRPRVDDPLTGTERPTLEPTAPIPNVPVKWESSSVAAQTFGLFPGDPVTLLVQERSTDEWRTTGFPDNAPLDSRRFNLSDAVALPGGRSFNPAAGLTSPLLVGTQVDVLGAHVIYSSIPVAGVKLGSAAAVNSACLGEVLTTFLLAFTTTLGGAVDPAVTLAAANLAIALGTGAQNSTKVKVDL